MRDDFHKRQTFGGGAQSAVADLDKGFLSKSCACFRRQRPAYRPYRGTSGDCCQQSITVQKGNHTLHLACRILDGAELLEQVSFCNQSDSFSRSEVVFQSFMKLLSRRKVKKSEVGSYADELCVSAKYLTMVCVKQSGRSAVDWINQFVMDDVAHYLKNTELSMKEISEQLGFANHSFFGKYVKAQVGTSPAEYRKRLRGKDSPLPTLVVPDAEK